MALRDRKVRHKPLYNKAKYHQPDTSNNEIVLTNKWHPIERILSLLGYCLGKTMNLSFPLFLFFGLLNIQAFYLSLSLWLFRCIDDGFDHIEAPFFSICSCCNLCGISKPCLPILPWPHTGYGLSCDFFKLTHSCLQRLWFFCSRFHSLYKVARIALRWYASV